MMYNLEVTTSHGSGSNVTINYESNVTETIGGTLTKCNRCNRNYSSTTSTRISGTGTLYGQDATHHYNGSLKS